MGIVTKEEIGVACREMVVRKVEGSRWGRASAQEIVSETASAPVGSGADAILVITTSRGGRPRCSFAPRGRAWRPQIIGQSESLLGVKIRYKLVQRGEGAASSLQTQPVQPADSAVAEANELSDASFTRSPSRQVGRQAHPGHDRAPAGFNGVWPWFRGPNLNAISMRRFR